MKNANIVIIFSNFPFFFFLSKYYLIINKKNSLKNYSILSALFFFFFFLPDLTSFLQHFINVLLTCFGLDFKRERQVVMCVRCEHFLSFL